MVFSLLIRIFVATNTITMLRKIRITLGSVMFIGLSLLFLDFTGTLHQWLSWMAKVQALEAVLALNVAVIAGLAVLTFLFGRIYCSIICPLGVMQDVFGWLGKKSKKNRYTFSKEYKWLRYGLLTIFIAGCLAGVGTIIELLAPYSAFGRICTMLLQPLWMLGNNALASIAEHYESYAFYGVDVWMKSLPVFFIALLTLIIIAILAWRNGRTYCNTICPVGTVLSFISRFSLLKIHFDEDKCKNCSLCTKNCKAACIDFKNHKVDYSRCVVCGDCLESCKFGALSYSRKTSGTSKTGTTSDASVDANKRSFLIATALVSTAALAQEKKHVDGGLADIIEKKAPERKTPIVPPGARSLKHMTQHCTGCQLCVSKCPNDVLRPSMDITNLMQPVMSFEKGYCRPECTRCSEVCPAGAIKLIDKEEKSGIQIGHAVVYPDFCLSALGENECGNCARHCPVGAIEMVPSDPEDDLSPSVPAVNENACIGCGACEHLCPVRPLSAIHVEGHEVHKMV
ncbi:4Fe-4S binding domain-containing protein [Prevotella communis]|uniref:4Fe-4S binding domain-containing protein n=2 Tax=Prevotella communis TaxID=2913614 RepID=A0A1H0J5E7_9BACT|nr:4Fe-4S binding domain-containing protein [Prevotella communis]